MQGHPGPAHLQHVLELVDAEPQLCHAGFEELPKAVLLHQPHKDTEGLLLRHLGMGRPAGTVSVGGVGGDTGCSSPVPRVLCWPVSVLFTSIECGLCGLPEFSQ